MLYTVINDFHRNEAVTTLSEQEYKTAREAPWTNRGVVQLNEKLCNQEHCRCFEMWRWVPNG